MKTDLNIRLIQETDLEGVLAIYKYYVDNTAISFEYEVPSVEDYAQRINTITENYPWLVCLHGTEIIGFAYGSTHRYRTAYSWSPESTIYLKQNFQSKGIGKVLYNTLFEIMKLQGYCNVFAGIALPNEPSVRLHKSLGFEEIGIFKNVGFKHGSWQSTQWLQLNLDATYKQPLKPKKVNEIDQSKLFSTIIEKALQKLRN